MIVIRRPQTTLRIVTSSRLVERLTPARVGSPSAGEDRGRLGIGARHDLARRLVARVLAHRGAAILDEPVEIEHGHPPVALRRRRSPLAMPGSPAINSLRYAPACAAASERWPFWWK